VGIHGVVRLRRRSARIIEGKAGAHAILTKKKGPRIGRREKEVCPDRELHRTETANWGAHRHPELKEKIIKDQIFRILWKEIFYPEKN